MKTKIKHYIFIFKSSLLLIITLLSIQAVASQSEINIDEILKKSKEACLALSSLEYEVVMENSKREIRANFIQQKEDVDNVGFEKSMVKVNGTIKEKGVVTNFSFSYDGDVFLFQKGTNSKQKKLIKPSRQNVSSLLNVELWLLITAPLAQANPYSSKTPYTYEGKEIMNGELCYKIKRKKYAVINGKKLASSHIWWISTKDFLPRAYKSGYGLKSISIINMNKKHSKSFFGNGKDIKEYTTKELKKDSYGENIIMEGELSPKWSYTFEDGRIISSEKLKGKVVVIDFWGTWCGPCKKVMPEVEALHQQYKNNKDVVVIGISARERNINAADSYFKNNQYTYTHIPSGDSVADVFKAKYFPTFYIIDKQGKVILSTVGVENNSHQFEKFRNIIDSQFK